MNYSAGRVSKNYLVTLTFALKETPDALIVIVAVPFFTPLIAFAVTVATFLLDVLQVVLPTALLTATLRVFFAFTEVLRVLPAVTVLPPIFTTGFLTVTATFSVTLLFVTVIVALPALTPVTLPLLSTLAIFVLEDL